MLSIELVTSKSQKQEVKTIIETYHSYVASAASVGRRIDWLIYVTEEGLLPECIGMIGLGSSVYPPPKDLLNRVGLSKEEYRKVFNTFANNWRFCFKKRIPNAGSQVLKLVRNSCQQVWKEKYGDDLEHLLTFVAGGNNGAVYKADNWEVIGETAGLPAHKSTSMKWDNSEQLKQKFVKPTGENKKIILYKKLR